MHLHLVIKPTTERYAYLVMTLSGIISLTAFMLYCRVGIHTLSLLSRLEKYVSMLLCIFICTNLPHRMMLIFCLKSELVCQGMRQSEIIMKVLTIN